MAIGLNDLILILGSLAFFIYGMKMMSDGIQRAAGSQLRNVLRSMTRNRFLGVFTGFFTTAMVQSSSATTVMTVSFVNAGLLTLVESAGVMMGANIGTTITGWIVSILGFKINLSTYSIPLFAFGVPMLFMTRGKLRYWGEFIIGFAILFLGLSYLKSAVPDIKSNPEILQWLQHFTEWGIFSRLLFVFVGALITIIVQSSSAAMTITLTMCAQGWLPLDVAAAMILGENIGTTITAELASLVGNVHAKRSARIHSMFNIIGVGWMVILMPVFLTFLTGLLVNIFGLTNPYTVYEDMPIALSAFHTAFNLTNVLVLIGFVPWLVKVAVWTVKSKGRSDEEPRLLFIDNVQRTPELATVELQKETAHFGEVTSRMAGFLRKLINDTDEAVRQSMYDNLKKYETITDKMEIEITEYITRLNNAEITPKTSLRLRSIINVANDMERIGDLYFQMSKTLEKKNQDKIFFLPAQRQKLNDMMDLIDRGFRVMNANLNSPSYDDVRLDQARVIEAEINDLRDKLRSDNLNKLGKKGYHVDSAMIYNNIFSALEKVGDHQMNISEAIAGLI